MAVWHKANMGKTETLRELARLLQQEFPDAAVGTEHSQVPATGDFRLEWRIDGRGVLVESLGDPGYNLAGKLRQPLSDGTSPRLIFCATRTSGETVQAVEDLADAADYEVIWTSTYQTGREDWQGTLNALKARHLIELLKELAVGEVSGLT